MMLHLSVVSPVYQAESLVPILVDRVLRTLLPLTESFEIVLVEDGSTDGSWAQIEACCAQDVRIKGIQLSRNFGQHAAIQAGLEAASGEWVVVMDCDLQDPPEAIASLYGKACEGYDSVLARRTRRCDSWWQRFLSKLFYRLLSFLTGMQYDSAVANFGIYHRKVVDAVLRMRERNAYFPAMVQWAGFHKAGIPVEHAERWTGATSYTFSKKLKLAMDVIVTHSDKPLRLIVGLGVCFSLAAFCFASVIAYRALRHDIAVTGYASLMTALSFFSGAIIAVLGVVGLYIGKIFEGIKRRPAYVVRRRSNAHTIQ
jgi:dolichol-phosphate mannosyltransferase